jgi:hypothetical protein
MSDELNALRAQSEEVRILKENLAREQELRVRKERELEDTVGGGGLLLVAPFNFFSPHLTPPRQTRRAFDRFRSMEADFARAINAERGRISAVPPPLFFRIIMNSLFSLRRGCTASRMSCTRLMGGCCRLMAGR